MVLNLSLSRQALLKECSSMQAAWRAKYTLERRAACRVSFSYTFSGFWQPRPRRRNGALSTAPFQIRAARPWASRRSGCRDIPVVDLYAMLRLQSVYERCRCGAGPKNATEYSAHRDRERDYA